MALGALLNSLGAVSSSLSGIGSAMSSLGGIASSIGGALGSAFSSAQNIATKAFTKIKEFVEEKIMPLWDSLKEKAAPLFGFLKDAVMMWVNLFTGQFGKARSNLEANFARMTNLLHTIWDNTVGGIWDRLSEGASKAFDVLGRAWNTIANGMRSIYDRTLGKVFTAIGNTIKKIIVFGGGILNRFTGGGGGGGETTNVGTSVAGGVTQTFNITINASGITDRSDKRTLAREISRLVEEEMSRSMRGSSGIRHGR